MEAKFIGLLPIVASFLISLSSILMTLTLPSSFISQMLSLSLLLVPGYLAFQSFSKSKITFNAKNFACCLLLSILILYVMTSLNLVLLLPHQVPFTIVFLIVLCVFFVFSIVRISLNKNHLPFSFTFSSDKKVLSVLVLLAIGLFFFVILNTPFDALAANDGYAYVSIGKALYNQGLSTFNLQNLNLNWPSLMRWQDTGYQPLYLGLDRIGFVFLEGFFGVFAGGSAITAGRILAAFFYAILPVATYLVASAIMDKKWALFAAVLTNFVPYIMWHSNQVLTEIPLTLLTLFAFYFLFQFMKGRRKIDFSFFVLAVLFSLLIKPMVIFLVIPFIVFISLCWFRADGQYSRFHSLFWVFLWFVPFLGCMILMRISASGSFRLLFSSLFNLFGSTSIFVPTLLTAFSPYFLNPIIFIMGLAGLPFMLGRKNWKYSVLLMFSTLMLVWLVGGIGLMEPRQGIIVYPLVVIAFVSLLNFVSEGRFAKLFLLIVPFIIGFFVYLIYSSIVSLNGLPVLLAPGFTITRPEAILQIVLSFVGVFSVTFLALTAVSKRLLFMLKNSNVGRFIIRRNLIVAIICITLIVTQGFLANQALVEGGTWSNISLQDVNLSQSADYLNRLPSSNGSLMTTLMASAPLNYLTSRVTLQPPPSEDDFYTSLQKQEFDYLVLVPESSIIWNPRPDYFEEFIYLSPDGMHEIYNVSGLQFFNSGLDDYNWEQFNNDSLAVYQDDGLYVGGNQSSGIDSGLVSKGIFYPFNLNVTCTLSSLGKSSHSPGVFWNNSEDFVGVSFQDNNWVISAFVNGNMTYYNQPGSLEQNASYVLSLIVTPRFVNAFINGSSIGVLSFSHIDGYGNILLKSIDGEEGFFANVTISQPQVSLIIYERDGA